MITTYPLFVLVNIAQGKIVRFYKVQSIEHKIKKNFSFMVTLKSKFKHLSGLNDMTYVTTHQ